MAKILCVEDQPIQRYVMAQMLELGGFEVAVAEDGQEGVNLARSWLPDLILMDLQMPNMNGFEAICKIRQTSSIADVPIITLSAQLDQTFEQRALDAGANAHFRKPVDLKSLMPTINRYLPKE